MVTSMKKEEVNKGRLTLASMLTGNPSNIGFSAAEPAVTLVENGAITLKATLRSTGKDDDTERLFIAHDRPNFQDWQWKTDYHRSFMEKNLDALLIAWCDPAALTIPVSYSQDVWTTVQLHEDYSTGDFMNSDDRYDKHTRDVCIVLNDITGMNEGREVIHVGTLEFPFSIMMIRETVMPYWQAYLEDPSQFHQHCLTCKKSVTEEMSFADRWSISFDGKCRYCDAIEVDLMAAVPKW